VAEHMYISTIYALRLKEQRVGFAMLHTQLLTECFLFGSHMAHFFFVCLSIYSHVHWLHNEFNVKYQNTLHQMVTEMVKGA